MLDQEFVPMLPEFDQRHIVRYRYTLRTTDEGDALTASGSWDVGDLDDHVAVWADALTRTGARMTEE